MSNYHSDPVVKAKKAEHAKTADGKAGQASRSSKYATTEAGKLSNKRRSLKYRYNLTIEQHDEMMIVQNGVCAICERPSDEAGTLNVDHDHITGQVRALLCADCNRALGFFKDDPSLMYKAADYIRIHREAA